MTEKQDYVLGKDITHLAKGEHKGTVVLSVRLSRAEFANIERISRLSGKTVSQVAREAIARYQPSFAPHVSFSTAGLGQWSINDRIMSGTLLQTEAQMVEVT